MIVVPPAFGTVGTRVGAFAMAFLGVEILSLGALLSGTDAATCVRVVCPAFLAYWLILGAGTFAGVVIIQPACGAVGTRIGALTVAFLLVEVLSFGAVGPLADTVTSV